ncbi:sensor histidine kinase [Metabacillus arenae]|uniref:histidine kinase n=1 Tax=Metabacillus arenae TaxID=2771434 RepID=A0A926NHA5_9BACI|nr:sensor histidine kinase [Metabacillus arenae]MBD1381055.1 sensor histidine kinase [Metabacillus arenae]
MKLFFRDQLPLSFLYIVQLLIISFVYWLDGNQNITTSLYAAFLSFTLFIGYLIFRYLKNRVFYYRLERSQVSLEDFPKQESPSPLVESLHELLKKQFRRFQNELHNTGHKLESHIQFINQWTHQMKTPISVIYLLIQDEEDKRFSAIGYEVDRLKKGLDMVLYSSRLDHFEHDFHVQILDLERIVRSAASEQKRLFIRKKVFPHILIKEPIKITSDEKWLTFVVTQLITNAVKYSMGENKKIYIEGFYSLNNTTVLEIRDEGVGIPKSDLPRVFNPYFTGENGRRFQESTGMGLYLVKQICRKLGHQVELESETGKGTTVRILF